MAILECTCGGVRLRTISMSLRASSSSLVIALQPYISSFFFARSGMMSEQATTSMTLNFLEAWK